jgi:integrase
LLTWFRFLEAVDVSWDLASRAEARDFALWLKTAKKPPRQRRADAPVAGSVNPVTGKAAPGENYAARTRRHARAAIRSFYEYHREMHGRPLVNPFPAAAGSEEKGLNAHHNPMQPFQQPARRAAYQPKEPRPAPRNIPDQAFNDLFAALGCDRDRALIAFYISTGARASELLGTRQGLVAPGEQTIGVVRKGNRILQHLPASADAFVWLRLYQQQMHGLVPRGADEPLWWTLRRPFRPLGYDAVRMVFNRANACLGANWTLHDLRHSAAKRMVRDPHLTLADVQWVLGTRICPRWRSISRPLQTRSSPTYWRTMSASAPRRPLRPHRRPRAIGPRSWRRCSAPRPTVGRPGEPDAACRDRRCRRRRGGRGTRGGCGHAGTVGAAAR